MLAAAPDTLRATTLSAVNTLQMGLMLLLFPLLGLVAVRHGVAAIFLALAAGLTLASAAVNSALGHRPPGEGSTPR